MLCLCVFAIYVSRVRAGQTTHESTVKSLSPVLASYLPCDKSAQIYHILPPRTKPIPLALIADMLCFLYLKRSCQGFAVLEDFERWFARALFLFASVAGLWLSDSCVVRPGSRASYAN